MGTVVGIKSVADYDPARVLDAMRACLEPLGGMRAFVKPGQRVLLKPNLLSGFDPDRAVTTHPAVVRAAILLVQEAGGRVKVGDSPGMGALQRVAHAAGLTPVIEETGAELVDLGKPQEFENPQNIVSRKLILTNELADADVVITLPKLKTHCQMILTAALKNQYGMIPGALKSQWHFRLQQSEWLAALILDVNRTAHVSLAILDAITAMEGPGPSSGTPRHVGALIAGADLAAVDTVACQIIGLNPMRVPLLVAAKKYNFGQTDIDQIKVVGEDWHSLRILDFKNVEQPMDLLRLLPLPGALLHWLRRQWIARPRIHEELCTHCRACEKGCPVSPAAIHPNEPANCQVNDKSCIRCYCCHEFCPNKAIYLAEPWLARMLPLTAIANGCSRLVGLFLKKR